MVQAVKVWKASRLGWTDVGPKIRRKVLSADPEGMVVLYLIEAGGVVPLHHHPERQFGIIVKGKAAFVTPRGAIDVQAGDSYSIEPDEEHAFRVEEETVAVDFFTPSRSDFQKEVKAPNEQT